MNDKAPIKEKIKRSGLLTLLAFAFALGVFVGSSMNMLAPSVAGKGDSQDASEGTFRFIRPSARPTSQGQRRSTKELKPFKYKVKGLVETLQENGDVSSVSVYFRDLNNGNWFGIGEHEKFAPKNALKVPLMIAYFKWAESNPLVLRKTLTCPPSPSDPAQQDETPGKELEPGKNYTVNDLIYRMIAHDDNTAYALLSANLPAGRLEKVFNDLYVEYDPTKEQDDSLSLNAFAAFFRVLYNASYLSEEMSEKALRYLSKASFRVGIAAGIPANVEIACKRGKRTFVQSIDGKQQELWQVHEFGIVYHQNRPFLLAVMARGTDNDELAKAIRDISRLVYEEVDKQS
jgi:beta-lactamase class A